MDNKESKPLVGRKFTNTEVNYYSSPIEAYGAKLTQSKYINIKGKHLFNHSSIFINT